MEIKLLDQWVLKLRNGKMYSPICKFPIEESVLTKVYISLRFPTRM